MNGIHSSTFTAGILRPDPNILNHNEAMTAIYADIINEPMVAEMDNMLKTKYAS